MVRTGLASNQTDLPFNPYKNSSKDTPDETAVAQTGVSVVVSRSTANRLRNHRQECLCYALNLSGPMSTAIVQRVDAKVASSQSSFSSA